MNTVDPRTVRVRRTAEAACLGLSGVCLLAGTAVGPAAATTAEQLAVVENQYGRFVAGTALGIAAALLLVPGSIGIAQLLRARGSGLLTTGAAMVGVGGATLAMGLWSYLVSTRLLVTDPIPRDAAVAVAESMQDDLLLGVPWILAAGMLLGLIVVGVALLRVPVVPRWLGALLVVAPLVTFFGTSGWLGALLVLPLAVALAALAVHVGRVPEPAVAAGTTAAETSTAAPAGPAPRTSDPSEQLADDRRQEPTG